MPEVDILARRAAEDDACRERLLTDYAPFVLSCASKASGHAVSRSDDEWSIALSAFNEAINCFDSDKGSFLSHARLVISRRIIDYQRKAYRSREVSVPYEAFLEDESDNVIYEVVDDGNGEVDATLRDELIAANAVLRDYGFSFFDLAGHTPVKKRPRRECADAVTDLADTPPLIAWMRAKRRLPLNRLSESSGARKKTLSLFRNFIITGAEVLTRDFPSLRRYFLFIRREARR